METCVCEICERDDAEEIEVGIKGLGVSCKGCGAYVITLEAQQKMLDSNRRFDLATARQWIQLHAKKDELPIITWTVAQVISTAEIH
ncbi:hypothetical protein D3C81_1001850 [compost metagenome]